jgi:Zn-dependent M28 family amino/carboxypeptidase
MGDGPAIVMLGAHLDSVLEGPGVNDNGSGVAAVVEIARVLAAGDVTQGVQFALWSAEELGTLGSAHYVESLAPEDLDRLDAYLNLDMLGSPNHGRYVYDDSFAPEGSARITELLGDAFDADGLTWAPIDLHGSSDHGPFMRAGVPVGGVFSGGAEPMSEEDAELFDGRTGEQLDPCFHLACDRLDNVDGAALAELATAVMRAVIRLLDEG